MPGLQTPVIVQVQGPASPFGGAVVTNPDQSVQQIEINTGSPVSSIFGRIGTVEAEPGDYSLYYAA